MIKQFNMTAKKTSSGKTTTTSKKATVSKKAPARKKIDEGLIRERAEEIYRRRVEEGAPGDADSDWFQAEEELKKS